MAKEMEGRPKRNVDQKIDSANRGEAWYNTKHGKLTYKLTDTALKKTWQLRTIPRRK